MKAKIKFLFLLSVILILTLTNIMNLKAQSYFTVASTGDYVFSSATCTGTSGSGNNTGVQNTGNDIFDVDPDVHVSVWDGSVPKLGWKASYGANSACGTINLGTGQGLTNASVKDPDVCLIYYFESNTWRILPLVVYYYQATYRYYLEWFDVSVSSSSIGSMTSAGLIPLTSAYAADQSPHTINIDSDEHNHFAIVWEDGASDIFINVGRLNSSNAPAVNCSTTSPVSITTNGHSPDVAIRDGHPSSYSYVYEAIFVSYISNSSGNIIVERSTHPTIWNNCNWVNNHTTPLNEAPQQNYTFYNPRIAASGAGYDDLWTVVFEETDGSNDLISGYTQDPGSNPQINYHNYNNNDGTNPALDITSVSNEKPVVTYVNSQDCFIYVGWTFDNAGLTFSSGHDAQYPIVLYCDKTGQMEPNAPGNSNFWDVPLPSNWSSEKDFQHLSLSARFHRSYLNCTYYSDLPTSSEDIFYKLPQQNNTGLRQESSTAALKEEAVFFPNPFSGFASVELPREFQTLSDLQLNVYDITGSIVASIYGNVKLLNKELAVLSHKMESGMYLFHVSSPSVKQHWRQKMIKL